jgi:Ni,Fe-hydrogenase III component G
MNEQFKAIFNQIPGSLLETSRFGRSESHAYWINSGSLFECAKRIRSDAGMNWLENLSCIQVDQSLVMTYFVRSSLAEETRETVILRASFDLPLSSPTAHGEDVLWVSAPSVSEVWPIAAEFEVEIARLFGVRFQRQEGLPAHESAAPDVSWNGFPLRKDFVFPDAERAGGFR